MAIKYIVRISKRGFPVTDPDPKNFVLREDTNSLKSIKKGKNDGSGVVQHRLGYKPFVLTFTYDQGTEKAHPNTGFNAPRVDDTNVYLAGDYYEVFLEGGA